jgi:hypothetical protein
MQLRTVVLGVLVVVGAALGAFALMNLLWPSAPQQPAKPALAAMPPLQPLTGSSVVLAPAAIALSAISAALDAQAPRNLSGKPQNPLGKLLANAQLTFTINRGPFAISGQPGVLTVNTPLSGQFQAIGTLTGTVGSGVSAVGGAIGNLVGGNLGQQVQDLSGKAFDQKTDIHGTVTTTARPAITPNWRLTPNLAGQVNVVDVVLPVGGLKLSVASAVKPALDAAVREQVGALETQLRANPFIETAARTEWTKLCRAISLGAAGQGMPNLWLEIRPRRAIAAAADRRQGGDAPRRRAGRHPHRAE